MEALLCYQKCLSLEPSHPQALTNVGNLYLEASMLREAATCYLAAVSVTTGLAAPYENLASIYKQQGQLLDAVGCYSAIITRVDPTAADAFLNRGNAYKEMGRVSEAILDYAEAARLAPAMAEAHSNLGSAYKDSGQSEAALVCYKKALSLRSNFPEASCLLLHTQQTVCEWENRDANFAELAKIIQRQLKSGALPSVQPFHALAYPLDPLLALAISQRYAESAKAAAAKYRRPLFAHPAAVPVKATRGSGRLVVGYVSSDFGNHPLSHLMGSVFAFHARKDVSVFCYALSANDKTKWRKRISNGTENFVDVAEMSVDKIAERIAEDGIQILVNLNGYTKGARNEIFALRPAPIQVSYMGFPGTMGADFIDYLVTDQIVSPSSLAHLYSEKLVYLPHCYFVNDYKQRNLDVLDEASLPARSQFGLPKDKFLFACFNQLYKMGPEIVTVWCNILKRVPNSALWLLRFPAAGEQRLRNFASQHGVKEDQIIFTDVAGKSEHIRRSALADLFLDTPLCNAHTTGTDVLWAGLPLVTKPSHRMATRVATSLCFAAGCGEEMVVSSLTEYEERAVFYATHPNELRSLRRKLKENRMTWPLFDTRRWVRNLERAFSHMWTLHCQGREPEPFAVTESMPV